MNVADLPTETLSLLRKGTALPAHPLLLDENRKLDIQRQAAVTRYYMDAGAGGVAVGVHTTQFVIRDVGLYEPVLRLASETAQDWSDAPKLLVAGVTGKTEQATKEAQIARGCGYL